MQPTDLKPPTKHYLSEKTLAKLGFMFPILLLVAGLAWAFWKNEDGVRSLTVPNEAEATAAVVTGAISPTTTLAPTATLLPATTSTTRPSPTPLPETTVVWTNLAAGVYLRTEPGGQILQTVLNGAVVTLLDQTQVYGNFEWLYVRVGERSGWIAAHLLYRVRGGYETLRDGVFLFEEPDRSAGFWLWPGTPYQIVQSDRDWLEIRLADGTIGWLRASSLQTGR